MIDILSFTPVVPKVYVSAIAHDKFQMACNMYALRAYFYTRGCQIHAPFSQTGNNIYDDATSMREIFKSSFRSLGVLPYCQN